MPLLPRRALLHPSWLLALALLGLNDHLLKHVVPCAVTGKLSDFAGLFLFPSLLAVFVRARSRRAVLAIHITTALAFAIVKTIPIATRTFEAVLSLGFASRVWTDPTDLIALPMVVLSWYVLVPMMEASAHEHWLSRASSLIGAVMCMATSAPSVPPLSIHNGSKHKIQVSFRNATSVDFDDAIVRSTPSFPFSPSLFGAQSLPVTIDVGVKAESSANLGGLVLVTIDDPALAIHEQWVLVNKQGSTPRELEIVDLPNGRIGLGPTSGFVTSLGAACEKKPPPDSEYRVDMPFFGTSNEETIESQTLGASGRCLEIHFENSVELGLACMPAGVWPFKVGDVLHAEGSSVVSDDGKTSTGISIVQNAPGITVDNSCAMVDSCGSVGFPGKVALSDGTILESGGDYTLTMSNMVTTRYVAGTLTRAALVRRDCNGSWSGLSPLGEVIEIRTTPWSLKLDASAQDSSTDTGASNNKQDAAAD